MELSKEEVEELARILKARQGEGRREPPRLRLIVPPTPKLLDHILRDAHIQRIMDLKRHFDLGWLVRQATFNVASVSCLEDCDLIRLLADMERAMQCILDGVSFSDVGLCRQTNAPASRAIQPSRQAHRDAELASIRVERDEYIQDAPRELESSPF